MIVVVVILLIAVVAVYGYYTNVEITALNVYAPDNVCGLNVYLIGYTGFNASTSSAVPLSVEVPNNNTTACTLRGVTTNTSGFAVSDVQLPGPIAGNSSGTISYGSLNFTLTVPGSRWSGIVNLVFS